MSRINDLLTEAAKAMEDGRDPFSHAFLSEHSVTLDEVHDMSNTMSVAILGYVNTSKETQQEILLRGSMAASGMDSEMQETASLFLKQNQAMEAIRTHND